MTTDNKTWSGRFNEPVSELVKQYTASINFDQRLARHDIQGSLAHAQMLHEAGVLSAQDLADIRRGMAEIQAEIQAGSLQWPQPQRPSRHRHPPVAARRNLHHPPPD